MTLMVCRRSTLNTIMALLIAAAIILLPSIASAQDNDITDTIGLNDDTFSEQTADDEENSESSSQDDSGCNILIETENGECEQADPADSDASQEESTTPDEETLYDDCSSEETTEAPTEIDDTDQETKDTEADDVSSDEPVEDHTGEDTAADTANNEPSNCDETAENTSDNESDPDTAEAADEPEAVENKSKSEEEDAEAVEEQSETSSDELTAAETDEEKPTTGNSYKVEVAVDGVGTTAGMGQDVELTFTFTELGADQLGSARIYLNDQFDYIDFDHGESDGIAVNSSYQETEPDSRWTAIWEIVNGQWTVTLMAIDGSGYLGLDQWVSATFNATTPVAVASYSFETEAWTDNTALDDGDPPTNRNEKHADHLDPPAVEIIPRIGQNILTDVVLKEIVGFDTDNNPILDDVPEPMPHPDDQILDLNIEYRFALPAGHQYKDGSYYEFQLPDVFRVFNEVGGDLIDQADQVFGTYTLDLDGNVRLNFNHLIEDRPITGFVAFNTEIIEEELNNEIEHIIEVEIFDASKVVIRLLFEPMVDSAIDKRGEPDRAYNTQEITWTVDFNKDLQTINNATLQDPIGVDLTLDIGSVELYELTVMLDGTVHLGDPVDPARYVIETIDGIVGGDDFQIRFLEEINSAYRLIFITSIDDDDGTAYSNTATLTGDEIADLPASATVSVGRGRTLQKLSPGYNPFTQTINWEIRANYNEKTLDSPQSDIIDTFGANQQYVSGSLVIYEVIILEDGSEGPTTVMVGGTDYNVVFDASGFEITFTDTIERAYKVQFQTEAIERVYTNTTIVNTVVFNGETETANRPIQQMILLKTHSNVNYAAKTVDWTIQINRDSQLMQNVEIVDLFANQGLTYVPGSFQITGYGGTYVPDPPVFTVDGFTITLDESITGPINIRFTTYFDYEDRLDPNLNYFLNRATVNWLDAANNLQSITRTRQFTPGSYTQANGFKGGSYNAIDKEITWEVIINYNLQPVNGATVYDYMLGDQDLIDGSIAVYYATLGSGNNVVVRGDPVAGAVITTGLDDGSGNPGFSVFLDDITTAYIIEYRTTLSDRLIVEEYTNTAYLRDGNGVLHTELDALVSVQHGGSYTAKSAIQAGRIVEWQIDINPGQSALSNVRVEDQLSPGQILLESSLALYSTTVDAQGNLSRAVLLAEGTDYELTVITSADHLGQGDFFELSFNYDIDRAYILEYQTFVLVGNNQDVSNNAVLFASEENLPDDTSSSETIRIRITAGQGGIGGELGSLRIRKVSANDGSFLPGAVFDIYHESGSFPIYTGVTDDSGELFINNVVYGTYIIREVSAPDGYLMRDTETFVTIDIDNHNYEAEILNDLIIRDVQLLKVDSFDNARVLEGAIFQLQENDGTIIDQYTTDILGIIYVADLEPGLYRFVEIQAAQYYRLDSTPVEFEIFADQITVLELTRENIFISVALNKVDDYDNSIRLAGVPFRLEDSVGNIIFDRLETDQDGRIEVDGLLPGDYRFIEIEPASHYQQDQTPIEFQIIDAQTQTLELVKENILITGTVSLLKVDRFNDWPLSGAVFRLVDQRGTVIHDQLVTDADGRLIIDDLRPGTYRLIEIMAPDGYLLPFNPTTIVSIGLSNPDGSGDLKEVQVSNTPMPMVLENGTNGMGSGRRNRQDVAGLAILPQTGGGLNLLTMATLALFCFLMVAVLKIKRFNRAGQK